jgi:hypothetical protein
MSSGFDTDKECSSEDADNEGTNDDWMFPGEDIAS